MGSSEFLSIISDFFESFLRLHLVDGFTVYTLLLVPMVIVGCVKAFSQKER